MDKALIDNYISTDYMIDDELGLWLININQHDRALSRYLHMQAKPTAAFITAYNPMSKPTSEKVNKRAHQQLQHQLTKQGFKFLHGYGQSQDNKWPAEQSVLVLAIDKSQANEIAKQYNQAAYVWIDDTGLPSLVLKDDYC
ncbi:DUF3293 domain-containing protein [Thalassotalea crassostreae]|uniref:DUF3293 domain-containing protein n=1 Tax=Thalassotalea crassostreae TaxID=1763536 RepID=UPI0008382473|nr:DUF3293 domain-containing protein [Thalassotalea crassostreae]